MTARDVANAVLSHGHKSAPGVVVVRLGKERKVSMEGSEVVEIEVESGLEMDHLLVLLGRVGESVRYVALFFVSFLYP